MSYYYKYKFTSPEGIYSIIKEELKSYFATGAIDDLMFPTYLSKALNHLGKSSYYIAEDLIYLDDFKARLPDNFHAVREAWLCTEISALPYQTANSFYSQATSQTTIKVSPNTTNEVCSNPSCTGCGECMPELIQTVYKTNNEIARSFKKTYLLRPGNINTKRNCDLECANFNASGPDSYDIHDNKIITNFRSGTIYLIFYANEYDDCQNQLVPDNYFIKEYVEKFLKFKMFETLCNQTNDETYNQLLLKKKEAKEQSDEAFILANTEVKKQTPEQKLMAIRAQNANFAKKYELPTRSFKWWRNVQ